jgi:hypothetical protein
MTGWSAVCRVSTMSDSETIIAPLPVSPSPEPEVEAVPICFRLPEAVVTRSEMRKHVLAELSVWLTGPVLSAAQAEAAAEDEEQEGGAVGQLIQIADALKAKEATAYDRSVALVGAATLTAETVQRFLLDSEAKPVDEAEDLMMDFVDEITVDGEQTLQDLWDYSPFEALREAPPLTEEDEDEVPETSTNLVQFLQMPLTFKVPVGSLVAVVVVVVAYLFLVAVVVYKRH